MPNTADSRPSMGNTPAIRTASGSSSDEQQSDEQNQDSNESQEGDDKDLIDVDEQQ